MKRILVAIVAMLALAIPAAALAGDHGPPSGGTIASNNNNGSDNQTAGDQTADPTNLGTATNSGSNTSTQAAEIGQVSEAFSQATVNVTQNGGNGSNASANIPSASGDNTSTAGNGGDGGWGFINPGGDSKSIADQGNSAGQGAAGNGGDGGNGGNAIVTVVNPAASGNAAFINQDNDQKIIVVAVPIQNASADYDAFTKHLLLLGLLPV